MNKKIRVGNGNNIDIEIKRNEDKDNNVNKNQENIQKMRGFSRLAAGLIVLAIILIITSFILFRLNFMVSQQLRVTLTPEYSEMNATGESTITFGVDTKLYNKLACDATCNYTLTDISHDLLLDEGSFNSKAYKNMQYSYGIPLNYLGYGVNTYIYRLECTNIRTTLCPSENEVLVRKSLLVVKYEPSVEQLSAAEFTRKEYTSISGNIINASRLIEYSGNIIDNVPLSFDRTRYSSLGSDLNAVNRALQEILTSWLNDDYLSAKSLIVNNNLVSNSNAMLSDAYSYKDYAILTINNHNTMLMMLNNEQAILQKYKEILSYSILNITSASRTSIIKNIVDGNSLITIFNNKQYDFSTLYNNVSRLYSNSLNLNSVLVNSTKSKLMDSYPALYVYSNMLCMMDESSTVTSDMNSNISVNISSDYAANLCRRNYGNPNNNISTLGDISTKLSEICADSSTIIDNLAVTSQDSFETLLMQYKLLVTYESINGQNMNRQNNYMTNYMAYVTNALASIYNVTNPEMLINGYEFNLSSLEFNKDNLLLADLDNIRTSCAKSSNVPAINNIISQYYSIPIFDLSSSPNSDVLSLSSLPEPVKQCCMYSKCQSCDKSPSKNPLILLHGHSFNQDTQAYQSIEIFNGFEKNFSNDRLYFQTGDLLKASNSTPGILGHYYLPIMSRPTYYLVTYNDLLGLTASEAKQGNIDTYALRLKESIDYTLYITGSDKVDVVAHSMGGLVLRRYMQIFGTQSIGKVILIGTPNEGISERTYNLCKIFGAVNECEDMQSSGIFIKKLNDLSNQQTVKETYFIVGKGCDTDGQDGDGVVTVNSSILPGFPDSHIFYVNGKCSGADTLHNDMLNPAKYPEVYNIVKAILD
jgi:hypothetical protein